MGGKKLEIVAHPRSFTRGVQMNSMKIGKRKKKKIKVFFPSFPFSPSYKKKKNGSLFLRDG